MNARLAAKPFVETRKSPQAERKKPSKLLRKRTIRATTRKGRHLQEIRRRLIQRPRQMMLMTIWPRKLPSRIFFSAAGKSNAPNASFRTRSTRQKNPSSLRLITSREQKESAEELLRFTLNEFLERLLGASARSKLTKHRQNDAFVSATIQGVT